jgi:NAD(P)-dependent dehydrogenase (short-subunit alcohol dehydrogenase family)
MTAASAGSLAGRRAIVTGAATGVGAAAVTALAAAGAEVIGVFHQSEPSAEVKATARWLNCDVRDQAAVQATFAEAARLLGGLDVLVHAAGLWRPSTPEGATEEEMDFLLATNVKATLFANQAAFDLMKDHGGRIMNLGSSEGRNGNPHAPLYALTKAAVHGWTRSAAGAWAGYGITVNALAPAVETPGAQRLRDHLGPAGTEMLNERLKAIIPIGGALGDAVNDLGPVVVFLASEGSRFMTGQLIAVDGGLMMLGA